MVLQAALMLSKKVARCGGVRTKTQLCVLLAGLLLCTLGIISNHHILNTGISHAVKQSSNRVIKQYNRTIKKYPACPIPQLEPFHESIQDLVDNKTVPPGFNCTASHTILFNSTLRSTIVPAKGPDYFRKEGYESCCYRWLARSTERALPDNYQRVSTACFPLNLTIETKIPGGHEFIAIYCKTTGEPNETLKDVHAFVPLKLRSNGSNEAETGEKFNVVIFGVDAVSRMNFLRTMPKSYSFLKNELDAVEMLGYNKVGETTIPNIYPLLMSAIPSKKRYLDDSPFIWKEYSKKGYYTMTSDDGSFTSLFNDWFMGFDRQPTDYYLRPLSHFADRNFNHFTCYGPRLTFQYLLDYMEKYVDTMNRNKKSFFQFTWAQTLTHDYMNAARLGDPHLLKSLRWMKESGHLKNTIFILMSDHGIGIDPIRLRVRGQLETRLPFMYFVLPDSFKTKYSLAYRNLLYNADKLVTTYDLHESLKDIPNLDMIGERELLKREGDLYRLGRNLSKGISLFLPVPEFRTCEMAGITMNFCSCNHVELVSVSNPEINVVVKMAVSHINSILEVNTNCSHLDLHNVSMAWRAGHSAEKWDGYTIHFETRPGEAKFEAMVLKDIESGNWTVQDPIVRANRYGNQSYCVRDSKLKPYCYCIP